MLLRFREKKRIRRGYSMVFAQKRKPFIFQNQFQQLMRSLADFEFFTNVFCSPSPEPTVGPMSLTGVSMLVMTRSKKEMILVFFYEVGDLRIYGPAESHCFAFPQLTFSNPTQ